MNMEVRGRDFEITKTLRAYIERRLSFALDRFADRIGTVRLRLADINGFRGGVDKSCLLDISLARKSPITIESRSCTVRGAIDAAAGKVARVLARRLNRKHQFRQTRNAARSLFRMQQPSGTPLQCRGSSPL